MNELPKRRHFDRGTTIAAVDAAADDALPEADRAQDPFLEALATAEPDDEPLSEEDRAAAQEGWKAYLRGESISWEEVRRSLDDGVAADRSS